MVFGESTEKRVKRQECSWSLWSVTERRAKWELIKLKEAASQGASNARLREGDLVMWAIGRDIEGFLRTDVTGSNGVSRPWEGQYENDEETASLGRKQSRVFLWSRFKAAADTMERARVLTEQPGYWA